MPALDPEARTTFAARAREGQRAKILHEIDPHGTLDPDAAALRVDEIIRARLTANGRRGAAVAQERRQQLATITAGRDSAIGDIDAALDTIAGIHARLTVALTDLRADLENLGTPR